MQNLDWIFWIYNRSASIKRLSKSGEFTFTATEFLDVIADIKLSYSKKFGQGRIREWLPFDESVLWYFPMVLLLLPHETMRLFCTARKLVMYICMCVSSLSRKVMDGYWCFLQNCSSIPDKRLLCICSGHYNCYFEFYRYITCNLKLDKCYLKW